MQRMSKKCKATAKSGKRCRAAAGSNGLCFLHANPTMAAELGRRGGRRNRRFSPAADDTPLFVPKTAADVSQFLGEMMAEIRAQRLDPKIASTLGYLGTALLKAIEVTDLTRRIEKLEKIGTKAADHEIIAGLVRLANLHPAATRGGISGQVAALMGLAKIRGLVLDRQLNLDEFFRSWSDDELLEYATAGKVPARFADPETEAGGKGSNDPRMTGLCPVVEAQTIAPKDPSVVFGERLTGTRQFRAPDRSNVGSCSRGWRRLSCIASGSASWSRMLSLSSNRSLSCGSSSAAVQQEPRVRSDESPHVEALLICRIVFLPRRVGHLQLHPV